MRSLLLLSLLLSFVTVQSVVVERVDAGVPGFKPLTIPVKDRLNANEGRISFSYTPSFNRNTNKLAIYRIFACGQAACGVNVGKDGKTVPWFLINTPATGANYGIYTAAPLEAGKTYRFQLNWDAKNMYLHIDDKLIGKKAKTVPMPFEETMFFGGRNGENADGILADLEFAVESAVQPVAKALPDTANLWDIRDNASYCSVAVESPDAPVTLIFRPSAMPVKAGQNYWVESNVFDPRIVSPAPDGSFRLEYPPCYNNNVTISPTGQNLLPGVDFENTAKLPNGWRAIDNAKPLPTLNQGHEGFSVDDSITPNHENGKNTAAVQSLFKRSGRQSLKMSKNSANGSLVVESPALEVAGGKKYLLTGYYHTADMKYGSGFAMIAKVTGDNTKAKHHYATVMSRQTRMDEWRMAYCGFDVPADIVNPKVSLLLTATGNPFNLYWDDFDLRERPVMLPTQNRPDADGQMTPVIGKEELLSRLSNAEPYTAERKIIDGMPQLFLNGKIAPKFGYAGFLRAGHKDFDQAGVHLQWLYTITGDGGKNNWRGIPVWLGDGKYDFSPLDQRLESLLRLAPGSVVMLYLGVNPYLDFFKDHPDALALDVNGKSYKTDNSFWFSYAAEAYRASCADMLRALAAYLKKSPYGKAVAGIHITGGRDGQWFPHPYDGSESYRKAFAAYLKKVYRNDPDALRQAWGDPLATFDGVVVPKPSDVSGVYFLDPANPQHRRWIDGERFRNIGPVETVSEFARIFKEAIGRPVYVSMYYNDIVAGHDLGKNALKEVLASPYIDGIVGVLDYGWTRLTGFTGASVNLMDSPALHGKIMLCELDYRTEYSHLWAARASGSWGPDKVGNSKGSEQSLAQQRRDMGMFLSHGQGTWMYALAGNGWPHPDMMRAIHESLEAAKLSATEPRPDDYGDVAWFMDEHMMDVFGGGGGSPPFRMLVHQVGAANIRIPFNASGLKTDSYLLSDLTQLGHKKYRMYVFAASPTITENEIAWIEKNLQKDGNVLVFLFDAGRTAPGGFSQNIKRLTGINAQIDENQIITYRYEPVALNDPLSHGLRYLRTETRGPALIVEDKEAVPIGIYQDTKLVGAAVKRHKNWTGIYIGAPGGVTPDFLRAAAAEAGITPVGPSGDATYAGHGFIVIHATAGGEKTISWQGSYDAVDLATGRIVAPNANSLTFPMEAGQSRWFRLQKR